jgi:hypothetical protein
MISVNYSDYAIQFDKAEAKLLARDIQYRELIKSGISIQEKSHFYIKSYGISLKLDQNDVIKYEFQNETALNYFLLRINSVDN